MIRARRPQRPQARALYEIPARPTKLRPWRIDWPAWGDSLALLFVIGVFLWLGWSMAAFLEGR